MNEFKTKLGILLRADTTLRSMLSKASSPYGVYFVRPPAQPSFPLVTFRIAGGSVGGGGRSGQTRSLNLVITAYSKTNCDMLLERVRAIINQPTVFTDMTSCKVEQIVLENSGVEDFDQEFQVYAKSSFYRVFLWKKITR